MRRMLAVILGVAAAIGLSQTKEEILKFVAYPSVNVGFDFDFGSEGIDPGDWPLLAKLEESIKKLQEETAAKGDGPKLYTLARLLQAADRYDEAKSALEKAGEAAATEAKEQSLPADRIADLAHTLRAAGRLDLAQAAAEQAVTKEETWRTLIVIAEVLLDTDYQLVRTAGTPEDAIKIQDPAGPARKLLMRAREFADRAAAKGEREAECRFRLAEFRLAWQILDGTVNPSGNSGQAFAARRADDLAAIGLDPTNPLYKINALRWLLMGAVAEISNNPAAAGAKPLSPDPWKKLPEARQAEVEQEARGLAALQSLPEVVQGMLDKVLLSYEVFSGRPDEAIARAKRMMGSKQTDRVGYSSLCAIYVQLEKWQELSALAKQWYAKSKSPETALLWIKSARKASNTAEEAAGIAAMRADYQRELLTKQTLAVHAALAGKYEESIDLLTTVTRIDPGNTEAWITLAATQQLAGKKEAALNAIRSAVSSDPQNPLATELYNILKKN